MKKAEMDLIPEQAHQALNQLYSGLSNEKVMLLDQIKGEILSNISQYDKIVDYRKPAKKVEDLFLKKLAHRTKDDQFILRRALVAKLALNLPTIVEKRNLPTRILALYPDAFGRLADFLKSSCDDNYISTGEFFCKDIRFVLGLSIPCGVLFVDMISQVNLPSVILSLFRSRKVNGIIQYVRAGGIGPWFRGHLDPRYLTEFNEQGFDKFYLRVAELLEQHNDIVGYVGTSWLYDPQLLKISPHLAFFQERPLERGAFSLKHDTQRSDLVNAIKASEARRRLYREGKYIPVCYSSLWPRKELIAWAEQYRRLLYHD